MKRAACLLLVVSSCREPAHHDGAPHERAASMHAGSLATAPVAGHLAGTPFRMRAAWYRVVRRSGHERVDLFISEGRSGRLCGRPTASEARQVLVRATGVRALPTGEVRVTAATPTMQVSYEVPEEHGYEGVGGGEALVVFDAAEGTAVLGRLRACFPDAHKSCVEGTFRAEECRDELDFDGPRGGGQRR